MEKIAICEVGPRDGLQNEKTPASLAQKSKFCDLLLESGIQQIEIGSFVNPKVLPNMADTDYILANMSSAQKFTSVGLIFNEKGLQRAVKAGVSGVCIVSIMSDTLCEKNTGKKAAQTLDLCLDLANKAKGHGLKIRIDLAPAWTCPFSGPMDPALVQDFADNLWELQPDELALCDTVGQAHPKEVFSLFSQLGKRYETKNLVGHFHDTQGLGLANIFAAIQAGVRSFDASLGGLGGCPFAPQSRGNVATEDVVFLCEKMGFTTGIQLKELWNCIPLMESIVKRPLGGQTKSWWLAKKSL